MLDIDLMTYPYLPPRVKMTSTLGIPSMKARRRECLNKLRTTIAEVKDHMKNLVELEKELARVVAEDNNAFTPTGNV